MRLVKLLAGGLTAAALVADAGDARAQEIDPSARYDIDDAMHRHPHDVDELPTVEEARGRAITFDVSLGGAYSTNAAATRSDRTDTGYLTPALGMSITPVSVAGWSIGGGALIDGDYYSSNYDDDLGRDASKASSSRSTRLGQGRSRPNSLCLGPTTTSSPSRTFTSRSAT